MQGFCYQENTHFSQAVRCSREKFWGSIRNASNQWKIDSRRDILDVVERHDAKGIKRWLKNEDYGKFLAKKRGMKKESARQKFFEKSDEERLLAFAQELKDNLTAFIFSCREFDEIETAKGGLFRHRRLADCHLNGLVMLDIDHVDNPQEVFEAWKKNDELVKRTALVHITSSKKGIRFVFTANIKDGNLADNQIVFAQALGYKADQSCIDATRNSFAPKEEDILYINEELLFDYYNEEFDRVFTPQYRDKKTQPIRFQFDSGDRAAGVRNPQSAVVAGKAAEQGAGDVCSVDGSRVEGVKNDENKTTTETTNTTFNGDNMSPQAEVLPENKLSKLSMLSSDKKLDLSSLKWRGFDVQSIIDCRYADKLPCAADSNRHNESLKLATDLLLMLDGDKAQVQRIVEAQPWVQEIIDERDENVGQTVSSAADCVAQKEKKYGANVKPSKAMQEAVEKVCGQAYGVIVSPPELGGVRGGLNEGMSGASSDHPAHPGTPPNLGGEIDTLLWEWGAEIEELSKVFPLIKDICKGLKKNQYPAALFVGGGLMMTLMTRCTYRFYHRPEELRRLNNSTLIIGDPASGKSFATRLFKLLASPIVAADKIGKEAINAYREQMRTKGANKEKPKKPKVVVRIHPARTSNAQFIQDMVNAIEEVDGQPMQLHMLTFDTELDNTLSLQKGGAYIDKQALQLKAFHNEEDGQAYSNVDSVFQEFYVIWNFIYTGTPIALKKMVNEQNFGSGLATRLTCIPLPATNFEMMSRESFVDYDSDERLKEWAEKLDRMKGELSVQKIVDELYDWTARRMEDAKENDSKADEMLLKRCAYHGLNFAAPFIVMRHWDKMKQDGRYWCGEFETDEVDWRLAELITNIQYACQRHYFGAMAEAYFDNKLKDASVNIQRKQKTFEAFSRLPEEFTNEDVIRCFNLSSTSSARGKICRLIRDHLVEKIREERGTVPALYHKTGTIIL